MPDDVVPDAVPDPLDVAVYAGFLADQITGILPGGIKATCDVRGLVPPALLVVPVPQLVFDLMGGGFTATWQLVALAANGGDLEAASTLVPMVTAVCEHLAVEQAQPIAYYLPGRTDVPFPAYRITYTTTHTPD